MLIDIPCINICSPYSKRDLSLKSLSKVNVHTKLPNTSLLLQADDVSNNKPTYRESNNTASVLSWKILPHGFCFFKAWLTALCWSLHVPCTTVSTCQSQFNLSQKLITFQKHLRTALHQSHYNDSCGETGCLQQDDFFFCCRYDAIKLLVSCRNFSVAFWLSEAQALTMHPQYWTLPVLTIVFHKPTAVVWPRGHVINC